MFEEDEGMILAYLVTVGRSFVTVHPGWPTPCEENLVEETEESPRLVKARNFY